MTARSSQLAWPSSCGSASGVVSGPGHCSPNISSAPHIFSSLAAHKLSSLHLCHYREGCSGAPEQAECVELLLALGEPAEELCEEFLAHARGRLEEELSSLEAELGPSPPAPDVLEFTDRGGNGFVGGLCQVAAAYQELFAAQGPAGAEKLAAFAQELGGRYFALVERRLAQEQGGSDNSLLVRALDRFHRRLRAPGALLAAAGLSESATEIVERVARERLSHHLQGLKAAFLSSLTDVRQALAAPRLAGKEGPSLAELLANVASSILSHIKTSLASVHLFTAKEVSFSNKPYFRVCCPLALLIRSADWPSSSLLLVFGEPWDMSPAPHNTVSSTLRVESHSQEAVWRRKCYAAGLKLEGYQGPHCCQPYHRGSEAGWGGLWRRVKAKREE